jgi:glucosamine--fructose-6-phosphate aminotransferase (isomerizing)
MCDEEPETLVAVRHECPLVVGVGDGEQFVASSITGFIEYTRDVANLANDEIAVLRPDDVSVIDPVPSPRRPVVSRVGWDLEAVTS